MSKIIRTIFIPYTLIIFAIILSISLSYYSINDISFYSTLNNQASLSFWQSFCIPISTPFILFYGKSSWVWVLFFLFIGISILIGTNPVQILKKFIFTHCLSFLLSILIALSYNSSSFIHGGIFGVLIFNLCTSLMPYKFWIPIFFLLFLICLMKCSKFPQLLFQKFYTIFSDSYKLRMSIVNRSYLFEEIEEINKNNITESTQNHKFISCDNNFPERKNPSYPFDDNNTDVSIPLFLQEIDTEISLQNMPIYFSKKRLFDPTPSIFRDVEVDLLTPYLTNNSTFEDRSLKDKSSFYISKKKIHLSNSLCSSYQEKDTNISQLKHESDSMRLSFNEGFIHELDQKQDEKYLDKEEKQDDFSDINFQSSKNISLEKDKQNTLESHSDINHLYAYKEIKHTDDYVHKFGFIYSKEERIFSDRANFDIFENHSSDIDDTNKSLSQNAQKIIFAQELQNEINELQKEFILESPNVFIEKEELIDKKNKTKELPFLSENNATNVSDTYNLKTIDCSNREINKDDHNMIGYSSKYYLNKEKKQIVLSEDTRDLNNSFSDNEKESLQSISINRDDLIKTTDNYPFHDRKSQQVNDLLLNTCDLELEDFIFPDSSDLATNNQIIDKAQEEVDIESSMKMIEDTYESFNINMQVVDYSRGPTITRFELSPPSGLKLRTIFNLQDDLALQAGTSNIRIISPVEGRSLIGIELPNKIRRNFVLRQMIDSQAFQNSNSSLPLILGVDVGGKEIVKDLAVTPHLLIAGTTGSGKSVYVNALIMGLLFKLSSNDLKFIMIDPKMVELELYSGIPHLLSPIITKPEEAMAALEWAVQEMDRRYQILSDLGVRNIKEYEELSSNHTSDHKHLEKLPYIVIIVDEFANLMLRSPKDTERHISRLASMSRAVGIHLVLATQRPSVDVVTGVIKANFPSRIALRVSSKIDSRTIIDKNGAEALLGGGDLLFMSPDNADTLRIQAPYVSNDDITKVVRRLKKNTSPHYVIDFSKTLSTKEESSSDRSMDDVLSDPLFEEVLTYAVDNGEISASGIQRRFRVGYNRASRLIDAMKEKQIISPPASAGKSCLINITRDEINNYLN